MSSETFQVSNGFQISLSLNNSNVLEIEALSSKGDENYSFAIDKTYLLEHSQFVNLIQEPVQFLNLVKSNLHKVVFQGGQLKFPFTGFNCTQQEMSILLFKEPGLKQIRQKLTQQQVNIKKLTSQNIVQNELIKTIQSRLSCIQAKIPNISNQIQKLQQKDIYFYGQIQKLKKQDQKLATAEKVQHLNQDFINFKAKFKQFQQAQKNNNRQIDRTIGLLNQKDKKFDKTYDELEKKDIELTKKIKQANDKFLSSITNFNKNFTKIHQTLNYLTKNDDIANKQIKQLFRRDLQDQVADCWITLKIESVKKNLEDQINKLKTKDDRINEVITNNYNSLNGSINQAVTRITNLNASISKKILAVHTQLNLKDADIYKRIESIQRKDQKQDQDLIKYDQKFNKLIDNLKQSLDKSSTCFNSKIDSQTQKLRQQIDDVRTLSESNEKNQKAQQQQFDNKITALQQSLTKSIECKNQQLKIQLLESIRKIQNDLSLFNKQLQEKDKQIEQQIKKLNQDYLVTKQNICKLQKNGKDIITLLKEKDNQFESDIKQIKQSNKCITLFLSTLSVSDKNIIDAINQLSARQERQNKKIIEWLNSQLLKHKFSTDQLIKDQVKRLDAEDTNIKEIINKSVTKLEVSISINAGDLKKLINDQTKKIYTEITSLNRKDGQIIDNFNKQTLEFKTKDEELRINIDKTTKKLAGNINRLSKEVANLQKSIDQSSGQIKKLVQSIKGQTNLQISLLKNLLNQKIDLFADRFEKKDKKTDQQISGVIKDCQTLSQVVNRLSIQGKDCLLELKNKDSLIDTQLQKLRQSDSSILGFLNKLNSKDVDIQATIDSLAKKEQLQTQKTKQWVQSLLKNHKAEIQRNFDAQTKKLIQKDAQIQKNADKNVNEIKTELKKKVDIIDFKCLQVQVEQSKKKIGVLEINHLYLSNKLKSQFNLLDRTLETKANKTDISTQISTINISLSYRITSLEAKIQGKADETKYDLLKTNFKKLAADFNKFSQFLTTFKQQIEIKVNSKADQVSLQVLSAQVTILGRNLKTYNQYFNKQISLLKSKDIQLSQIFSKNNFNSFANEWKEINFKRKFGNNLLNKNSELITSKKLENQLENKLLVQIKETNSSYMYNFANIYEVRPLQQITYKVKILKKADIYLGFCTSDALSNEVQKTVFWAFKNSDGRVGQKLQVFEGEILQVIINLKEKHNYIQINRPTKQQLKHIKISQELQGKGLYLQVGSYGQLSFELS